MSGPCDPWPVDLSCCTGLPDDVDPQVVQRWQAVASRLLWAMSGRRWGPCPTTVRPCRLACLDQPTIRWQTGVVGRWVPYTAGGRWFNASVCGCAGGCSCTELCEVWLRGPVYDVTEVRLDGRLLEPESYRVDSGGRLLRVDGGCWPACSDLTADCGEPGAFCVSYRVGLHLDEAAVAAVSELTCELVKACLPQTGDCRCRLPGNVQRVVRQGVTIDMLTESTSIWREGRTGLPLVDAWLAAVNPDRLTRPPRVLSPDWPRTRSTTWP